MYEKVLKFGWYREVTARNSEYFFMEASSRSIFYSCLELGFNWIICSLCILCNCHFFSILSLYWIFLQGCKLQRNNKHKAKSFITPRQCRKSENRIRNTVFKNLYICKIIQTLIKNMGHFKILYTTGVSYDSTWDQDFLFLFFLVQLPFGKAFLALLLLWMTGVQFLLHSCEQFSVGWRHSAAHVWERSPLYSRDPPTCLDRQLTQPLSCFLPTPAQPSIPFSSGGELVTDSHRFTAEGRNERLVIFDHSILSAEVAGGQMQHQINAAST